MSAVLGNISQYRILFLIHSQIITMDIEICRVVPDYRIIGRSLNKRIEDIGSRKIIIVSIEIAVTLMPTREAQAAP